MFVEDGHVHQQRVGLHDHDGALKGYGLVLRRNPENPHLVTVKVEAPGFTSDGVCALCYFPRFSARNCFHVVVVQVMFGQHPGAQPEMSLHPRFESNIWKSVRF